MRTTFAIGTTNRKTTELRMLDSGERSRRSTAAGEALGAPGAQVAGDVGDVGDVGDGGDAGNRGTPSAAERRDGTPSFARTAAAQAFPGPWTLKAIIQARREPGSGAST